MGCYSVWEIVLMGLVCRYFNLCLEVCLGLLYVFFWLIWWLFICSLCFVCFLDWFGGFMVGCFCGVWWIGVVVGVGGYKGGV